MKLRYWGKTGVKMALIILMGSVIYTVLVRFGAAEPGKILDAGGCFSLGMGTGFCFLLEINLYKLYIPLAISFGATRREAFWGVQICRVSYTLPLLLMSSGALSVGNGGGFGKMLPVFLGIYLLSHALSGVLAAVYGKFGAKGLALGGAVMVAGFAVAVTVFVMAIIRGAMPEFSFGIGFGVLAVGALAYLLAAPLEARSIGACTVKL